MNELADLIREQAHAMNMSAMSAYDAGLNEGFRRGIARAAELVRNWRHNPEEDSDLTVIVQLEREIRALKLKP